MRDTTWENWGRRAGSLSQQLRTRSWSAGVTYLDPLGICGRAFSSAETKQALEELGVCVR